MEVKEIPRVPTTTQPSFLSLSRLSDTLDTVFFFPMVLIKLIYEFATDRILLLVDVKRKDRLDTYLIPPHSPHSLRLVPTNKHLPLPESGQDLQSYFFDYANCLWNIGLPEKLLSRWLPIQQKWEFVNHDQSRYSTECKEELQIGSMRYRICMVHGTHSYLILYVPFTNILECLHLDVLIWTQHHLFLPDSKELFELRLVAVENDQKRLFLCGCVNSKRELMITEVRLPLLEDSLTVSKIAGYLPACRPLYIWNTPSTQMVHVFATDTAGDATDAVGEGWLTRYSMNLGSYKNYSGAKIGIFVRDMNFMECSSTKLWVKVANQIIALDTETLLDSPVWIMENSTTIILPHANLESLLVSSELAQQLF